MSPTICDQCQRPVSGKVRRDERGEPRCRECPPIRADGGRSDLTHADRWALSAWENLDRWGEQSTPILVLALAEELGEIADEMIAEEPAEPADLRTAKTRTMLSGIRDTGRGCRRFLERVYEDENGEPVPPELRPDIDLDFDVDAVQTELDDAAPLAFQLAWALDQDQAVATDGGTAVPSIDPAKSGAGEWNPQPTSLRDGETRDDARASRTADFVRDGYRELLGLGERIHLCDVCDREFDGLEELAGHDCSDGAGQELSARDVVERTGGDV